MNENQIHDITDFVLRFHNCDREYKVFFFDSFSDYKRLIEEIRPNLKQIDTSKNEHGNEWDTWGKQFETVPCQCHILKGKDQIAFIIAIFSKFFFKFPFLAQIEMIVHEARHIVDFPQFISNQQLDVMLVKEYLKEKRLDHDLPC